jgi:hypothetical protein
VRPAADDDDGLEVERVTSGFTMRYWTATGPGEFALIASFRSVRGRACEDVEPFADFERCGRRWLRRTTRVARLAGEELVELLGRSGGAGRSRWRR